MDRTAHITIIICGSSYKIKERNGSWYGNQLHFSSSVSIFFFYFSFQLALFNAVEEITSLNSAITLVRKEWASYYFPSHTLTWVIVDGIFTQIWSSVEKNITQCISIIKTSCIFWGYFSLVLVQIQPMLCDSVTLLFYQLSSMEVENFLYTVTSGSEKFRLTPLWSSQSIYKIFSVPAS